MHIQQRNVLRGISDLLLAEVKNTLDGFTHRTREMLKMFTKARVQNGHGKVLKGATNEIIFILSCNKGIA